MNLEWPSLQNKPCQLCGTNPAHAQQFCLEYKCPHCHLYALEHLPQQCKWWPWKPRWFQKAKEEPVSLGSLNWDYGGYYEIEGYKEGTSMGKIDCLTPVVLNLFLPSDLMWLTFLLFKSFFISFCLTDSLPSFQWPLSMPFLCKSPQPIIYSNKYFLPGGDLYILVDSTMFRIHQYLLAHDSETIHCKLEIAESDPKDSEYTGNVQTNPLFLQDQFTNPHTFHLLLSIIYNPWYNIYEGYTRYDWFDILYITISWGFQEIEWLAMYQIELIDDQYCYDRTPLYFLSQSLLCLSPLCLLS